MDITVHNVEIVQIGNVEYFAIAYQIPMKAKPWLKIVPVDILETRAAEYDLDPVADLDELLEIIMYEKFSDEPTDPNDVAHLHNAPTIKDARVEMRKRIKKAKGAGKLIGLTGQSPLTVNAAPEVTVVESSGVGNPLAFIKARCDMNASHMQVKKQFVERSRAEQRDMRAEQRARIDAQGMRTDNPKRIRRRSALALRQELLGSPGGSVLGDEI